MNFPHNVKVLLANNFAHVENGPWWCQYTLEHDGAKLEITGYGPTIEAAVDECNEKFRPFVPVLPLGALAPIVEAKQLTQFNDEIPF